MLLILCHVGGSRYAVESRQVKEVLPRVALHRVSQGPSWLAGLLIYRGAAIPVVDLGLRTQGVPSASRLSSRIVILQFDSGETSRTVGILVERVEIRDTQALTAESSETLGPQSGIGRLLLDEEGALEFLDVPGLLGDGWSSASLTIVGAST
jgi:chemotaxis-related protein WspB